MMCEGEARVVLSCGRRGKGSFPPFHLDLAAFKDERSWLRWKSRGRIWF